MKSLSNDDNNVTAPTRAVIYQDAQSEEHPLGEAELLELTKTGLPFILDEEQDHKQKVYILKYYKVNWLSKTELGKSVIHSDKSYPVRELYWEGITSSQSSTKSGLDENHYLIDKFIIVNGTSCF